MRLLAVLFVGYGVVFGVHADEDQCLGQCPLPGSPDTYLPHQDCNKFCHCVHSGRVVQACPPGLHFNPRWLVCDWPETAGCISGLSSTSPTNGGASSLEVSESSSLPLSTTEMGSTTIPGNTSLPDSTEVPGTTEIRTTEAGTTEISTNHPSEVSSSQSSGTITSSTLGGIISETTTSRNASNEGLTMQTTLKPTTENLGTSSGSVETIFTTKETIELISTLPTSSNLVTDQNGCIGTCPAIPVDPNTHLPNLDCTKFCHCGNNGTTIKHCPQGLHFNLILKVCDWPENAGCMDQSTTVSILTSPITEHSVSNSTTILITDPSITEIPSTISINIINEIDVTTNPPEAHTEVSTIPEGTSRLPEESSANLPVVAGIESTTVQEMSAQSKPEESGPVLETTTIMGTTITEMTTNVTSIPTTTGLEMTGTTIFQSPKPESTSGTTESSMIQIESELHLSTLPITTITPILTTIPEVVTTTGSSPSIVSEITPGPIKNSTSLPLTSNEIGCIGTCPPIPIHNNTHLPNEDCAKFCHCTNHGIEIMDCPKGLHFNPILKVCDWPARAGCTSGSTTMSTITNSSILETTGQVTTQSGTSSPITEVPAEREASIDFDYYNV